MQTLPPKTNQYRKLQVVDGLNGKRLYKLSDLAGDRFSFSV
ncbi:hypothetical protein [Arthrospira platensis]|nr:hypothetical protein [Arthrospira platensis]MDF2209282.1 hypothetical protein [Arthrospira platensis NCB002]MDT9184965.1 hypothetical protein [Limnospira sp. PMC 289.06]MDT9297134.1 hypothetical protein [Arthrospira platensis PCC 7345]MDT9312675.1 hypothetical protein [Limnospira sp. Paracas R14]WAK74455.1 hypothetical protein AP9108_33960 [Arthrospira sp. PCC 9108]